MMFLIAIISSMTKQKTRMFILEEEADVDEIKDEVISDLKYGEDVFFYVGCHDRQIDIYAEVTMKEDI